MASQVTKKNRPQSNAQPRESTTAYSCDELLEALRSIQRTVQCSSCHNILNSARMCINGHGICGRCTTRCNHYCPLCRAIVLDSRPIILNDIIKVLPRKCNFVTKGCYSLVLPQDTEHETFCRFRHTYCRMPNCGWKGMVKDLLLHLEKIHGKEVIRTESSTSILMDFNTKTKREGMAPVIVYNNIFWQHVKVQNYRLMQFYQYVPVGKPTKKYIVALNFHTPETSYAASTPVHTDIFDPAQLIRDKETFALPKKIAQSFNKFHSGVHYNYKIHEVDL